MSDDIQSVMIDGIKYYSVADLVRFLGYTSASTVTNLTRRYRLTCRKYNQRMGDSKDKYYISAEQAKRMCAAMNPKIGRGVYAKHRENVANLRNFLKSQEAS